MDRWTLIESLFEEAVRRPPSEREAFLREACAGVHELYDEVASLLSHDGDSTGDQPWAAVAAARLIRSSSPSSEPTGRLAAGTTLGPYAIVGVVGAGAMGEVYRAQDRRLNRDVAIKILPAEFAHDLRWRARFEREARVLGSLNHPNIAAIHDVLEGPGDSCLVLEYVEGEDLAERVRRGPLPLGDVLRIGHELARALQAAHAKRIVHRDLKPANIKVTPDGVVKVLDFGIALSAAETVADGGGGGSVGARTRTLVAGTPAYMSPEQAAGRPVDERTDVWAFGCVVYELLTGRRAFMPSGSEEPAGGSLELEPDWTHAPEDAPAEFTDLLRRCLRREISERAQDAGELERAIGRIRAEYAEQSVGQTPPFSRSVPFILPSTPRSTAEGPRKRTLERALTALGVAVLVAIGLFFWRGTGPTEVAAVIQPVHRQLTFAGTVNEAALAPDGRTLVYTSEGRLLVQGVAGGSPVDVAGQEVLRVRITRPRWSPRGDEIGFVGLNGTDQPSPGAYVVPRAGGPSRLVAMGGYSAWSPDGSQMAVAYQNSKGFSIVDVSDGRVRSTASLGNFQFLHDIDWHPRSNRLALLERKGAERWVIWVVSPDGRDARAVHADAETITAICWSPIQDVVYFLRSQNEASELVALDVADTLSPAPRVLISGLPTGGSLTIASDGRTVLHIRSNQSENLARLDLTARGGAMHPITQGTQRFRAPSVSPDRKWIAAVVGVPPRTRLVKIPFDGGDVTPLTSGEGVDGAPSWSPDRTRIAFGSTRSGSGAVWLIRPDATGLERVNDSAMSVNLRTAWTPDGRLLWQTARPDTKLNYRIRDLTTLRDSTLLPEEAPGFVFDPKFSPDGAQVAVYWNRDIRGLYVLSWPARIPKLLSNANFTPIGWTADSKTVIAIGGGVWSFSVRDGRMRRLADVAAVSGDVTRDGHYAVVSISSTTADAWLIQDFDPRPRVDQLRAKERPRDFSTCGPRLRPCTR